MPLIRALNLIMNLRWIVVLVFVLISTSVFALPMVPMSYSGNLGYTYNFTKSDDAESETTTIQATIAGSGFVWQPWFITLSVGLSVGVSESDSNSSNTNTSNVASGNVQFTVFPQSRFPFVMAISRSDSRLENSNSSFSNDDHFTNLRIFMSQTYFGRSGFVARFSWDHNQFDSERSDSESDSLAASFRAKEKYHRYFAGANFTRSERSTSKLEPENSSLDLQHNYTPNTDLGVTSIASYTKNDAGSGDNGIFENVQGSSVFSWRPIDRPYTVSGGARVSTSETGLGVDSNSVAANIGASYRFTRSLRLLTSLSVSASENNNEQATRATETANLSYNSQQYFIGGFNWNWNSNISANNTNSEIDDEKSSQQSYGLGLGHSFSRAWSLGRTASVNFAFSENFSVNTNSEIDEPIYGMGNGVSLGWSRRGVNSGTFASVSFSDSRTSGEEDTSFQLFTAQLTQRNGLSRVSSISLNTQFQASRQELPGSTDTSEPKTLTAQGTYSNGRFLGIYALRFSTKLAYNKRIDRGQTSNETRESESRLDYRVGLLTMSSTFRIMSAQGGTTTESIGFSATRTF